MIDKNQVKELVQGHAASGLSVEAYCRKAGVPSKRFYYWRKVLEKQRAERFVEVRRTEVMAEVSVCGSIAIKVPVSAVAELVRSLKCLQ